MIWEKLLKNHPHDSICGVSIDDVHIDMEKRFGEVVSLAEGLMKNKLKELVLNIDTFVGREGIEPYIIFNPSLKARDKGITIKTRGDSFKVIDSNGKNLACQKRNKDNLHNRYQY